MAGDQGELATHRGRASPARSCSQAIVSQRFVLNREAVQQTSDRVPYETAAQQLRAAGIKPPCAIISPSVAYYVGCIAPWTGETMPELLAKTRRA